jgi:hypothetical protein
MFDANACCDALCCAALCCAVQFQGAISDFHPIREAIKAADYDPLLIRLNDDDLYGDGNNFEVATTQVAN